MNTERQDTMTEDIKEKAWNIFQSAKNISPVYFQMKLKVTYKLAKELVDYVYERSAWKKWEDFKSRKITKQS